MSKRVGIRLLYAVICVFSLVPIAAAADVVYISQHSKIGVDTELEPGTYRVEVQRHEDSAEVLFFQERDLVATAHATLSKEEAKSNQTEVHSEEVDGERVITSIWLQGWKESLVFRQDTSGAE